MATTVNQDRDFIAAVIEWNLLEQSIEWIKSNLEPEDVFGEDIMIPYAKGWAEEHANEHFKPGDLFGRIALEEWAEDNGFVEEE